MKQFGISESVLLCSLILCGVFMAGCAPTAAFTAAPTTGATPLTVYFMDQSAPGSAAITLWSWDFGDGTKGTSVDQNPAHTYSAEGTYNVSLTVKTSHGEDTELKQSFITVSPSGEGEGEGEPAVVLFDNSNQESVSCGPAIEPQAVFASAVRVTKLTTWHGCQTADAVPGTIGLRSEDGFLLGPWQVTASTEPPGTAWIAEMDAAIGPGTYTVVDSDPAEWQQNAASETAGFARIEGFVLEPAASGTIGAEGGILEGGGMSITIPAGALDATANLSVSIGGAGESDAASALYFLEGLPPVLHDVISVALPLEFTPDGEVWLRFGEPVNASPSSPTIWGGLLFPAVVDGGVARAEIPPNEVFDGAAVSKAVAGEGATMNLVTGRAGARSDGGNFLLVYPAGYLADNAMEQRVSALNAAFEEALTFLTTGTGLTFRERTAWPMTVEICPYGANDSKYGLAIASSYSRNRDYITLNQALFEVQTNLALWRATGVHELFHILQYNYVSLWWSGRAGQGGWLYDASSTWSEWGFCGTDHWPNTINENGALFPVNGLLNASTSLATSDKGQPNPDFHGYASSLFLRYLVNAYGDDYTFFGRLWPELRNGAAVSNAFWRGTGDPAWNDHWEPFGQALFGGDLVDWDSSLSTDALAATVGGAAPATRYRPQTVDDALAGCEFVSAFQPLSAVVYSLVLECEIPELAAQSQNTLWVIPKDFGPKMAGMVGHMEYDEYGDYGFMLWGDLSAEGTPVRLDVDALTLPPDGWGRVFGKVYIIVTNREDAGANPVVYNARVQCKFSNAEPLENLYVCKSISLSLSGAADCGGTPCGRYINIYNYAPDGPLQWNGKNFTASGTKTTTVDTYSDKYTEVKTWDIKGEMNASGARVNSITAVYTMNISGEHRDPSDLQMYTFSNVETSSLSLTLLPYDEPPYVTEHRFASRGTASWASLDSASYSVHTENAAPGTGSSTIEWSNADLTTLDGVSVLFSQ